VTSIKVETLPVGELATNCYLVWAPETKEAVIIDPGDEANFISEKILQLDLKPKVILATHGHFDHILAARELQLAFRIPFGLHQADEPLIRLMTTSARWWLKREIVEQPPRVDLWLEAKQTIKLGRLKLKIIHLPGHTPGGVGFYSESERLFFSGDTIFYNAVGRTDLPYSSRVELEQSLRKIKQHFDQFMVYPGHGPQFKLVN